MANTINYQKDFSLVTAILRKDTTVAIVKKACAAGAKSAVAMNARGTLIKDKWYQMFMPAISPEQEVVEIIVKNSNADTIINTIVNEGKLHLAGAGAVYSMPCEKALLPASYSEVSQNTGNTPSIPVSMEEDLTGIFCIVQKSKSEAVAKAAVSAGSPGPTVVFGQGKGLRERMGILRIAISPEKEFVRVIVHSYDAETVFETMVAVGKLDMPGMGFIYMMPIQKGLINIAGIFSASGRSASMHQIIKAIDELKRGKDWRALGVMTEGDPTKKKRFLSNLSRLTCVVERGRGDLLTEKAMAAGAPGASIMYGREISGEIETGASGIEVSKEKEIIEMTVSPQKVDEIVSNIMKSAEEEKIQDVCIYTNPVPKALTYLG
jgi:nitrogen regulatory protein PII